MAASRRDKSEFTGEMNKLGYCRFFFLFKRERDGTKLNLLEREKGQL